MPHRVGLVFELRPRAPVAPELPPDAFDEYEPEETIAALEGALRKAGCEPVRLGPPRALLDAASLPAVDAALSIAEGYGTRNREAWAPVLLEMRGIPALGSDALTLSLSLDKAWTKTIVAEAGVAVAPSWSVAPGDDPEDALKSAPYPLFVKPRWEGTAKGIDRSSRAADPAALAAAVARVHRRYGQPALVEPFLPGAEYTVTVVGEPPRALPVLQRGLDPRTGIGEHALPADAPREEPLLPGSLDAALEASLADQSLRAFRALVCRDFARFDWKLDAAGTPRFLEANPLPTFAPDGSFAILAELLGTTYEDLVGGVLRDGLRRILP